MLAAGSPMPLRNVSTRAGSTTGYLDGSLLSISKETTALFVIGFTTYHSCKTLCRFVWKPQNAVSCSHLTYTPHPLWPWLSYSPLTWHNWLQCGVGKTVPQWILVVMNHHDVSHCIRMNIWPNPSFTPIFAIFVGEIPHLQTSIMFIPVIPPKIYQVCYLSPYLSHFPTCHIPIKWLVSIYIYQ